MHKKTVKKLQKHILFSMWNFNFIREATKLD